MDILIISMFYYPEPVVKPHDLALELTNLGHRVTVITGIPNYPDGKPYKNYQIRFMRRETIEKINVIRVAHIIDRNRSSYKRVISYVSFSLMAFLAGMLLLRKPDVIWTYQIGLPGAMLSLLRSVPLVHDVQDLWPEWIISTGIGVKAWMFKLLDVQERFIYRIAKAVTINSRGFYKALLNKGVPPNKLTIIPLWANDHTFLPVPVNTTLAQKEGMDGKFNVLYAGNVGPAQGLTVLIDLAERLRDEKNIQFVILGDGIEREKLKKQTSERNLPNLCFLGSRPSNMMASYYALADVLLMHLKKDPMLEVAIPSKLFGYLACGKPILAALTTPDVVDIVNESGAGLVCPPEDVSAMERAIRTFYALSPEQLRQIGHAGRETFLRNFTREILVQRYIALFYSVFADRNKPAMINIRK